VASNVGRMRSLRVLPAVLAALLMVTTAPAAGAPSTSFVLAPDEPVFWSGPGEAAACGSACWAYDLHVTEPAFRLRVGIDRPYLGNVWTAELVTPSGYSVGTFTPGTELYSAEIVETDPEVGTYTVYVYAGAVSDRRFRMRAVLETDEGLPDGDVLVPPNLRALPPWDFSFTLPLTNGSTAGGSTGVATPGGRASCHAEEVALYGAVRCLRMAFGVSNTGLGPLELQTGPGPAFADRPLIQHVRTAGGGTTTRSAGNAYYHHSHQHYHHDRAVGLELLRVTNPATGALVAAAQPHRKGFAHRDELLREWDRFYPRWTKRGFGLLPGWGDYYEWDRPGNYIDFGLNGDGLYVVRITADPDGFILETDPSDNVAYSLIRVAGDAVTHLESGHGTDPWDPCRVPLPLGPEFANSFDRATPLPEECR
jgi:hypothetical protein